LFSSILTSAQFLFLAARPLGAPQVLPGLLAVKAQLREPFEARRFGALALGDAGARLAKKRAKALFPEAITGAYTLAVTVLFGVSAWAVGRGQLTPGGIVAFFSSLVLLVEPIQVPAPPLRLI